MERHEIQTLLEKLNAGELNAAEQLRLESLIASGEVSLEQVAPVAGIQEKILRLDFPGPSPDLDDRFYQMLAMQKKSLRKGSKWSFDWPTLLPRLAFAGLALVIGVSIGLLVRPAASQGDVVALTEEVSRMKEMMMLTLLEKESATERLKAVNLTHDMAGASSKVTNALIQTLNNDDNVNVRLAALEALVPYVRDSAVREALIRSIAQQQSPLVQVALADLMAQIQAKSSVKELQKVIQSEKTPEEVKTRIKESIKILS